MQQPEKYRRDAQDEILWSQVDQLHAATLQISDSCFQYKKLCIALLGAAVTVLLKFTDNGLDHSLFVLCITVILGFWIADANAYFYQKKLRGLMVGAKNQICERSCDEGFCISKPKEPSVTSSLFNWSMTLYYFLLILSAGGWIAFCLGWIKVAE